MSGIVASVFAVSRMTTMLTEMKLIPHNHFGMSGGIKKHMLVYVSVIAIILTVFFDLSRIASLGAIFYLIMDIAIQWGVLRNLRNKVKFNSTIVITAITLDIVVLGAFLWIKATTDITVLVVAFTGMVLIFYSEKWFLKKVKIE